MIEQPPIPKDCNVPSGREKVTLNRLDATRMLISSGPSNSITVKSQVPSLPAQRRVTL